MTQSGDHQPRVVPAQRARGAVATGRVRLVLATSIVLAVAVGVIVWFGFFY